MQFVVVSFPESRSVLSGGNAVGPTNQTLALNGGTHTFTLSDPPDYAPPAQQVTVAGTSASQPLMLAFTRVADLIAQKLPSPLRDLTGVAPTVDAFLAHFAPLNLQWRVERDNAFGKARALTVLEFDKSTGEIWALGALEQASAGKHRHNPGGAYGELVVSLAGELNDVLDDTNTPVKLGPGSILFHAANTVHQASADVFWAGIYHQPRNCTPVA